ncbi:hypothetical protein [Nocardioides pelophilus]|uniref:hypothetical protein n=1 Tax=Nocardioides pelophilus TaxID=2172019 RepID=UPI001601C2E4|nr:hypothetical protein [Nocardioides pelophilus]
MVTLIALGAFFSLTVTALLVMRRRAAVAQRELEERRASVAAGAAQREWSFATSDPALVTRFPGAPFGLGDDRSATNVVRGRHDGRDFVAFDYDYTTPANNKSITSATHHPYSVLAVDLGLTTPGLAVGPTDLFGTLVNAITGRDVRVGNDGFDKAFTVTSPSREFALDLLGPGVVEVLMHHRDLAWRLEGDSMLIIRAGQHSIPEVEAKLHFIDAVLDRIPDDVRSRLLGEEPR